MSDNSRIFADRLKELRKNDGCTQRELAHKTGLSYGSIVDYENARRKPNSEALASLERYFNVSGDFLLGNSTRDIFQQNALLVDQHFDTLISEFQVFQSQFSHSSQEAQIAALNILNACIEAIESFVLPDKGNWDISFSDFYKILEAMFCLNPEGVQELSKRCVELAELRKYRKI